MDDYSLNQMQNNKLHVFLVSAQNNKYPTLFTLFVHNCHVLFILVWSNKNP